MRLTFMEVFMEKTMTRQPQKKSLASRFKKQIGYQLLVWPAIVFTFIFSYIPMAGIIIAFKNYKISVGIWESAWVGLENFKNLFNDFFMGQIILNTVVISVLGILVSYPVVMIFTLLLNEVTNTAFKRVIQTISYLPHFISWTIMAVILTAMLSAHDGIINEAMLALGIIDSPINYMTDPDLYWGMVTIASVWKELGWSAIVYLAVISGIDMSLYEAAKIDGAGRLARMWYITLPMLKGIIAIQLILSFASMPSKGFDQAYFLANSVNMERARTLSYYVYNTGLVNARFSYSTAIGLVLSLVSAGLLFSANTASKKLTGRGLY
ncbi:MAG: sugar ABC transporter permease [Ruminococcaceae bacterium]|nr:sugar ABC transporter permease [Oscillospiraceae bacterium]